MLFAMFVRTAWCGYYGQFHKVSKGAKIRSRYNQVPHLTQDTNGKVTNSQLDTTNESQEVSPFPAGDHKAHINRHAQRHSKLLQLIWALYIYSFNGNTQVRDNPGPKWGWALKMGQWPISYSNTCRLHNFNGPFEISMGPLQMLMGQRILNIYIRA